MKPILDWQKYLDCAAQAAAEGIVMLRNERSALPLPADEEIAVFGRIQLHYYKSGTGSGGMVNVSKVTGILDGLIEAGIKIYAPVLEAYRTWDAAHPYDLGGGWGGEPWSQEEMPPDPVLIQSATAACKRAVVIIGRTAGEEQDNRMEKGSFLLTDTEEELLRQVRAAFDTVIVLLNTGNIIDMHFVDTHSPDAVLYVWQGGMTGGTGTAKVLTGSISPCGKLPDTIAYEITDYPSDPNFGGKKQNIYAEDIYVGYRYFETFAKERVRYPFGFGLSYTSFAVSVDELKQLGEYRLSLSVTVTNTGSCAGKEVVQVYCEAPQGKLGKPARVLCDFKKTDELAPNASQTIQIWTKVLASYDDSGVTGHPHCWVYEAGEYRFYIGTDVRSAQYAASIMLDETVVVRECRQAMAPVQPFQRYKPEADGAGYRVVMEDVPLLHIDEEARRLAELPEEWTDTGDAPSTLVDVLNGTVSMKQFIAQLSDEELACIVRGEGMGSPRVTAGTASAFGGVSDALAARKIPAGCCSDGPSGMRLDCGTKAFSLPNGTMLASTFNRPLMTELFYCVGLEMTGNHVDCLLGPGMNIHRHPLNGRNFEYFSEDPYLTGEIAFAELAGLHQAGVTGTVKHCCGNNQETGRHFLDSVVSERALREIYLKGFEKVFKTRDGSIMTTYGSVNGVWTAGNYDLCTEIIRREWGFQGFIMTDWWANINRRGCAPDKSDLAAMVRAQNDVYMVCADSTDHEDNLLASLADGTLTRAELQRCAARICRFLMHTHAMQRLLGNDTAAEIINRPAEEMPQSEPVVFHDADEDFTLSLRDIPTERGTDYAFALRLKTPGWYRITLTASSTQSPLAQIPVTLFSMGTASGTFTWSGTEGKPVSFTKNLPLFSRFMTMRLYFAQSGLRMEEMHFEMLNDHVHMASMGTEPENLE